MAEQWTGRCFCGAVKVAISGPPRAQGYCHCTDCRAWSAGPVNAFALWSPEAVRVTAGEDRLQSFAKTANSHRAFCADCGGHVLTRHPGMDLVDVYPAVLARFDHAPTLHVFYGERMMAVPDGLPKFRDLPAELGGSGDTLAE